MDMAAAILLFGYEGSLLSEVAVHQALCKAQRREARLAARYWQRDEENDDVQTSTLMEVYDAEMSRL